MEHYVKYVGDINCRNVREFILKSNLSNKKIALHPKTYDELVMDYKETFKYGIDIPFRYLGVEIVLDETNKVPLNRVMVVDSGTVVSRARIIDLPTEQNYETIYRCGYCGAIAGPDGEQLAGWKVQEQINRIQQTDCEVEKVVGDCCRETHHKYRIGEL